MYQFDASEYLDNRQVVRNQESAMDLDLSINQAMCKQSEVMTNSTRQMHSAISEAFAEISELMQLISLVKKHARRLRHNMQELSEFEVADEQQQEFNDCVQLIMESAALLEEKAGFAGRIQHLLYDVEADLNELDDMPVKVLTQ